MGATKSRATGWSDFEGNKGAVPENCVRKIRDKRRNTSKNNNTFESILARFGKFFRL